LKFSAPERLHETSSILRTHSYGMYPEPHCLQAISAWCMCTDPHIYEGGGDTHHAYTINNRCQCTKFSHMGDLMPWICAPLSQKTIIFINMSGQKDIFAYIHHENVHWCKLRLSMKCLVSYSTWIS